MKFKASPVTSLEDATIDFEQLEPFLTNGDITSDSTGSTARITKLNGVAIPLGASSWLTPSLINSWTANTAVRYLKDPLGFVHLRGSVTTGTSGTTAFILPAGFRPALTDLWPDLQGTAAAGSFVTVGSDGTIKPTYTVAPVWLNSIIFLAEN